MPPKKMPTLPKAIAATFIDDMAEVDTLPLEEEEAEEEEQDGQGWPGFSLKKFIVSDEEEEVEEIRPKKTEKKRKLDFNPPESKEWEEAKKLRHVFRTSETPEDVPMEYRKQVAALNDKLKERVAGTTKRKADYLSRCALEVIEEDCKRRRLENEKTEKKPKCQWKWRCKKKRGRKKKTQKSKKFQSPGKPEGEK